jgi:Histidine-specific methyltransferase, SAM-dependent
VKTPPVLVDAATLESISRDERPDGWSQRWVYVGEEAAKSWLRLGSKQDFRRPVGRMEAMLFQEMRERARRLTQAVLGALGDDAAVKTFVSMGPGDGKLDEDIARALGETVDHRVTYLPIDISQSLLTRAATLLSDVAQVSASLLCDFESRFAFISEYVAAHTEGPRMFALLGNTLGNLDLGERAFVETLREALGCGDSFLLSVAAKGPDWSAEKEPNLFPTRFPLPVQQLLGGTSATALESRPGKSDVPHANAVEVVNAETGSHIITVRRYDWVALLDWLQGEMGLAVAQEQYVAFDDVEAAGVVRLRRQSSE